MRSSIAQAADRSWLFARPYPTPTGVPLLHPMNLDFSKRAIFRSLNMGSLHERGHFSRRDWLVYVIVVALTIGAAVAVALV
jgi:hypothetical protein